jgi:uncharacterized protein
MADRMNWYVDAWDPAYGSAFEGGAAPDSPPEVDPAVEVPADAWTPLSCPDTVRAPDVVLLVDGVRRVDATLWSGEMGGRSYPALAASYAAGVVRCDLRHGVAEVGATPEIRRGLFTAAPGTDDLVAGSVRYIAQYVDSDDPDKLPQAIQPRMTELEILVSLAAGDAELLVVDGPLRGRRTPNTLGYVKTQRQPYLPAPLIPVVTALKAGQRTPVFLRGTSWRSYSWYLRLPAAGGAPWAGVVRMECPADLTPQEAVRLADLSLATLPRFASAPYKDPRAPQNLMPIAGLERRLRGLLGDARLLHRALTISAHRAAVAPTPVAQQPR